MRLIKVKPLNQSYTVSLSVLNLVSSPSCLFQSLILPTILEGQMGVGHGGWGREHSRERESWAQGLDMTENLRQLRTQRYSVWLECSV